jgi:O-methyltransferase involved in polyketide biosynthesis
MEPGRRRCGRTHCPPDQGGRHCEIDCAALRAVPSTLLIPLAARAHGASHFPWLDCHDADAAHLLSCLNADVSAYLADRATVLNILWRTKVLKAAGQAFFQRHPQGLGVCVGCGLSNHFQWMDVGRNRWIDADLPEVMALRNELLPPVAPRQTQAVVDLARPGWWQRLGLPPRNADTPVWLLCEGVLMYFAPHQARAVLREFAEQAPAGSELLLDTLSHVGVGRARLHASVGQTAAEFRWGLHRLDELTEPHPRLQLLHTRSVAESYGPWALWAEACWQPWAGAPLYGMATLAV